MKIVIFDIFVYKLIKNYKITFFTQLYIKVAISFLYYLKKKL